MKSATVVVVVVIKRCRVKRLKTRGRGCGAIASSKHKVCRVADQTNTQRQRFRIFPPWEPVSKKCVYRIHVDDRPKRCKTCVFTHKSVSTWMAPQCAAAQCFDFTIGTFTTISYLLRGAFKQLTCMPVFKEDKSLLIPSFDMHLRWSNPMRQLSVRHFTPGFTTRSSVEWPLAIRSHFYALYVNKLFYYWDKQSQCIYTKK